MSSIKLTDSEIEDDTNQKAIDIPQKSNSQNLNTGTNELNTNPHLNGSDTAIASVSAISALSNLITGVGSYVTVTGDCINLTFSFPKSKFSQMSLDVLKEIGIDLNSIGSSNGKPQSSKSELSDSVKITSDTSEENTNVFSRETLKSLSEITRASDMDNSAITSSFVKESNKLNFGTQRPENCEFEGQNSGEHRIDFSDKELHTSVSNDTYERTETGTDSDCNKDKASNVTANTLNRILEITSGMKSGGGGLNVEPFNELLQSTELSSEKNERNINNPSNEGNSAINESSVALEIDAERRDSLESKVQNQSMVIEFTHGIVDCSANATETNETDLSILESDASEAKELSPMEMKEIQNRTPECSEVLPNNNPRNCGENDKATSEINVDNTVNAAIDDNENDSGLSAVCNVENSTKIINTEVKTFSNVLICKIDKRLIKVPGEFENKNLEVSETSDIETANKRGTLDCTDKHSETPEESHPREVIEAGVYRGYDESSMLNQNISSDECPEWEREWPQIVPFTEIEIIPAEEIKSDIATKYYQIKLFDKCIIIKVMSNDTREVSLEVAEYKKSDTLNNAVENLEQREVSKLDGTASSETHEKYEFIGKNYELSNTTNEIGNIQLEATSKQPELLNAVTDTSCVSGEVSIQKETGRQLKTETVNENNESNEHRAAEMPFKASSNEGCGTEKMSGQNDHPKSLKVISENEDKASKAFVSSSREIKTSEIQSDTDGIKPSAIAITENDKKSTDGYPSDVEESKLLGEATLQMNNEKDSEMIKTTTDVQKKLPDRCFKEVFSGNKPPESLKSSATVSSSSSKDSVAETDAIKVSAEHDVHPTFEPSVQDASETSAGEHSTCCSQSKITDFDDSGRESYTELDSEIDHYIQSLSVTDGDPLIQLNTSKNDSITKSLDAPNATSIETGHSVKHEVAQTGVTELVEPTTLEVANDGLLLEREIFEYESDDEMPVKVPTPDIIKRLPEESTSKCSNRIPPSQSNSTEVSTVTEADRASPVKLVTLEVVESEPCIKPVAADVPDVGSSAEQATISVPDHGSYVEQEAIDESNDGESVDVDSPKFVVSGSASAVEGTPGVDEGPASEAEDAPGVGEGPASEAEDAPGVGEGPASEAEDAPGVGEGPASEAEDAPGVGEGPASEAEDAPGVTGSGTLIEPSVAEVKSLGSDMTLEKDEISDRLLPIDVQCEELSEGSDNSPPRTLKVSNKKLRNGSSSSDNSDSSKSLGMSWDSDENSKDSEVYVSKRHQNDAVDAAPTRVRTKNHTSKLSKDVIPENSVVTKFVKDNTKTRITSASTGRMSPVKRSLRSKSLEPNVPTSAKKHSSEEKKSGCFSKTSESNSEISEINTRRKRAETPLKDIMISVRSTPRKLTKTVVGNSGIHGESSETPKLLKSSNQSVSETQGTKVRSNLSAPMSSVSTRRTKRGTKA